MGLPEAVSICSFLSALLAAVYARWSSLEAKRSNELTFHSNKIEIYKAFFILKYAVIQKAASLDFSDTGRFYFSANFSEFYFNRETYEKILEYFGVCFALAQEHEKSKLHELSLAEVLNIRKKQTDLLKKERDLSKEAEILIKGELLRN